MIRTLILLLILSFPVFAQTTQEKVRDYRRANEHQILQLYIDLLRLPNVASDVENIRRNGDWIMELMKMAGPRIPAMSRSARRAPVTPTACCALWVV